MKRGSGEAQGNNYAENAGTSPGTLDRRNLSNSYVISPNDIPHRVVSTWVVDAADGQRPEVRL